MIKPTTGSVWYQVYQQILETAKRVSNTKGEATTQEDVLAECQMLFPAGHGMPQYLIEKWVRDTLKDVRDHNQFVVTQDQERH